MPYPFRTARGRVSNAGDEPRYVGRIPCAKAEKGELWFRSVVELCVGQFLAWSPEVQRIFYERRPLSFESVAGLPALTCWPDYEIVLDSGEIEWIEAKASPESLAAEDKARLELIAAHCARESRRYRVIYRSELEKDGFIETISLLRPYGRLTFGPHVLKSAIARLGGYEATHLDGWSDHARAERVPLDVLFHLLYHQHLPLKYRPLVHTELRKWHE